MAERGAVPSVVVANELPHCVNGAQNPLRSQEREEEVGSELGSDVGSSAHEEAVPDEIVVRKVVPCKATMRPSISITGGASGSSSIKESIKSR